VKKHTRQSKELPRKPESRIGYVHGRGHPVILQTGKSYQDFLFFVDFSFQNDFFVIFNDFSTVFVTNHSHRDLNSLSLFTETRRVHTSWYPSRESTYTTDLTGEGDTTERHGQGGGQGYEADRWSVL
jgi:hypothetical protein